MDLTETGMSDSEVTKKKKKKKKKKKRVGGKKIPV